MNTDVNKFVIGNVHTYVSENSRGTIIKTHKGDFVKFDYFNLNKVEYYLVTENNVIRITKIEWDNL